MKIGAILGHAKDEDADLLYSYAENLGIAFQIQDDILDAYGDEALVGKQPGGDIIQNKKTLLFIEAEKQCVVNNDNRLHEWTIQSTFVTLEKVTAILSIFNDYNIKEFALQQRDFYVQQSLNSLAKINLSIDNRAVLKSLVDYLVVRDF
jgi:geranylgeranyl diphosphate synthase type II